MAEIPPPPSQVQQQQQQQPVATLDEANEASFVAIASTPLPADTSRFLGRAYGGSEGLSQLITRLHRPPKYSSIRFDPTRTNSTAVCAALTDHMASFNQTLIEQGRQPVKATPHPLLPDCVIVPSAPQQQSALSLVTTNSKVATGVVVIDMRCCEAIMRGAEIFCVGVFGLSKNLQPGDIVAIRVTTRKDISRGSPPEVFGPTGLVAFGEAMLGRSQLVTATEGVGVRVTARLFCDDAPSLNGLGKLGLFPQNLPSMLVAHVLDPQAGDVILDMCAAPGGKTTHIAARMRINAASNDGIDNTIAEHQGGCVVACDRQSKTIGLRENVDVLGYSNMVTVVPMDARRCVRGQDDTAAAAAVDDKAAIEANNWSARQVLLADISASRSGTHVLKDFPAGSFDRVLLDGPCSALGLRPRLSLGTVQLSQLVGSAQYSKAFVVNAYLLVRPGGVLVWSTCTISPLENEVMVRFILDSFSDMKLVDAGTPRVGGPGLVFDRLGVDDVKDTYCKGITEAEASLVQRFDPRDESVDSMGFFIAKFQKDAVVSL